MKVKCCQLLDEETGDTLESSSWLTIGRIYHALSIHMEAGGKLDFRLIGNDGTTPAFHDAEQFQACLRPRDRFWDIPVPKIDSAFDNSLVPQPSWSPSTTQQLRKLVAAPYLAPNDWTPRSEAYFASPLAQGTTGKQCGLAATGDYQPSLRSPWLAASVITFFVSFPFSLT